jgi:preprotein translocase subunit YajC
MLSLAALQAPPGGGRTGTVLMIYMVAFAFIMWFLIIRPQRKVQEKHKGDEVMTEGGIIGQVVHLTDDRATLKSGENTRVVVARSKIARVMTPPAEQA